VWDGTNGLVQYDQYGNVVFHLTLAGNGLFRGEVSGGSITSDTNITVTTDLFVGNNIQLGDPNDSTLKAINFNGAYVKSNGQGGLLLDALGILMQAPTFFYSTVDFTNAYVRGFDVNGSLNVSGDLDVSGTIYGDSVSLSGYISGGNIYGDNINISYDIDVGGDITANGDINADNVFTDYADKNRLKLEAGTTQIWIDPANGNIYFLSNGTVKHTFYSGGTKAGGSIEIDGINLGMSPVDSPQIRISTLIMDVELLAGVEKEITFESRFAKAITQYAVLPSQPVAIRKESGKFYAKSAVDCTCDFNVDGYRAGRENTYWQSMEL